MQQLEIHDLQPRSSSTTSSTPSHKEVLMSTPQIKNAGPDSSDSASSHQLPFDCPAAVYTADLYMKRYIMDTTKKRRRLLYCPYGSGYMKLPSFSNTFNHSTCF